MSIFGSIVSAIFGHKSAPAATTSAPAAPAAAPPAAASATPAAAGTPKPMSQAEVVAMIEKAVDGQDEDLNWRQSIVDLMKALKLDSSLAARKQLAQELHYGGDTNDSATMNVWLHKQVMTKLAENGGKVPDELKKG